MVTATVRRWKISQRIADRLSLTLPTDFTISLP